MTDTNHRRTGKKKNATRLIDGARDTVQRAPCQARAWARKKKHKTRVERRKSNAEARVAESR